jgi:Ni/Fe-hydrogenase subunit HybB-like protein
MIVRWQRGVPVYGIPIISRPFLVMAALAALGWLLITFREFAGLGLTTGMNDRYAWGIWKTFNTMVLTALGSGSFAIGIAAWVFKKRELHSVMRTALLLSFLIYLFGVIAIMVDVGRPWNTFNILLPWRWNLESPLWEVSLCMPLYAFFPLFLENTPPILERAYYLIPPLRAPILWLVPIIRASYPWVVALAYTLPLLHQSSLGALMLLAGNRVHPLWQTPFLPLLYVWSAAFIGCATLIFCIMSCSLLWKRPLDLAILAQVGRLASNLALAWVAFRLLDLIFNGKFPAMFSSGYALLFWLENLTIGGAAWAYRSTESQGHAQRLYVSSVVMVIGGMIYRYSPAGFAYSSKPLSFYTPSVIEILIATGLMASCVVLFLIAVKRYPILPAPISEWPSLVNYYKYLYPWIATSSKQDVKTSNRPSYAD